MYTIIDKGGENVYFYSLWDDPKKFGFVRCKAHDECVSKCLKIIKSRYPDKPNSGYHSVVNLNAKYKVNGKMVAKMTPGFKWK